MTDWEGEVFDPTMSASNSPYLHCGDDIAIVGYPFSLRVQGPRPVWKHGSIASEPGYAVNSLPILLADTDARGGMSGSPVYTRKKRINRTALADFVEEDLFRFVGVYCGRIGDDLQIGRITRLEEIMVMLDNPVPGNYRIISEESQIFPDVRPKKQP